MRVRRMARWVTGLVAVAAFGLAAVVGAGTASAGTATDPPASGSVPMTEIWD